jgi:hypothetical protein
MSSVAKRFGRYLSENNRGRNTAIGLGAAAAAIIVAHQDGDSAGDADAASALNEKQEGQRHIADALNTISDSNHEAAMNIARNIR